jgi:hypothetical protein
MLLPLVVYFALCAQTSAYLWRPLSIALLLTGIKSGRNVLEYGDRAGSFGPLAVLATALALRKAHLDVEERLGVRLGLV